MGWEYRKGKPYYYRKERQGSRVVSTYVGVGQLAALLTELGQLDRQRRQQERQIAQSELAELAATPAELTMLLAEARRAVAEALTAAGYHQHKREWRKRRAKKEV